MTESEAAIDRRAAAREQARQHLAASIGFLAQARGSVEANQCLTAMHELAHARKQYQQAIAALLSGCLRHAIQTPSSNDGDDIEQPLLELINLACFSLSNLCLSCRHELKERLEKE